MIVGTPPDDQSLPSTLPGEDVLVRLRVIGQMEAWTRLGESVLPSGRKTRALLAILGLSAPRPVLRSKLAEMLWSRRPEEQARASLRQEIHRLTEALAPVGGQILLINRDNLLLRPGAVWMDVEEVLRATPERPAAMSLLDGDLLEELDGIDPAFDAWLVGEREQLLDRARALGEHLLYEKTDADDIIANAQQLLAIDRAHEGAWRALMRAYAARGERGMAIQAYERCRAVLADQLEAHPSEETQRIAAEIRAAAPLGGGSPPVSPSGPPLSSPRAAPRSAPRGDGGHPDAGRAEARATDGPVERRHHDPRAEARPHALGGNVRIGVLPLQPGGTGEAESFLCTGIADEITAALARFRWMFLVSSSALARFAAQTRDETAIRRTFALDYLLDGTIRRAPDRLRVALRLLDLRAGNQVVWTCRFDRADGDLLSLQDEVAAAVAARLDTEIALLEAARISARGTEVGAFEMVLRALPLMARMDRLSLKQGGDLLRRAVASDPEYAAAQAWLAFWHVLQCRQGWTTDRHASIAEAGRLANRAITLDPQDARALTIAGHVRARLHHRLREALALHERALALNPNMALAWAFSGAALTMMGDLDQATERMRRYKKLTPLNPQAFYLDTILITIALLRHDHEEAVRLGRAVNEMNQALSAPSKPYLAALGHLGRTDEATALRGRLLGIEPDFTVQSFLEASPLERDQDREHFARGLQLAGIPER